MKMIKKDKTTVEEISTIVNFQDLSAKDKKCKLERKKHILKVCNM